MNRIAGVFYTLEQLMDLPNEPESTPVADSVTQLNPMQLWADRATVTAWVEDNLEGIKQNRHHTDDIPSLRVQNDALIRQREAWLEQLAQSDDPVVYIGMYPMEQDQNPATL